MGREKERGGEGDFAETILESGETELVTVTSYTKSPGCLAVDGRGSGKRGMEYILYSEMKPNNNFRN